MTLFPIFVKLHGRRVVIVGAGRVGEEKIPGLLAAGARLRVIAPHATEQIADWSEAGKIEWVRREFEASDLHEAFLVVGATSKPLVNEVVFREAESRGVLCNAVDDPKHCHFYYGSIVQRGDLQIAISTNGKSPALAQRLRQELESQFGPEYELWLEWLGSAREILRASESSAEDKKAELHHLASQPMFEEFLKEVQQRQPSDGAI